MVPYGGWSLGKNDLNHINISRVRETKAAQVCDYFLVPLQNIESRITSALWQYKLKSDIGWFTQKLTSMRY